MQDSDVGEGGRQRAEPADGDTDHGRPAQQRAVVAGFLQDAAAGGPEAEQEDDGPAGDEGQRGGDEGDEQARLQPDARRGEPVGLVRRVGLEARCGSEVAERAQFAAEQGREGGSGRDQQDQRDAGPGPPLQGTFAAPQEGRAEDEAQDAVEADDVPRHQQGGVRQADDDQPEAAPAQGSHRGAAVGAGGGLAEVELHHAVAEEEGEERVDPQIEHDDHGELHGVVEPGAVHGLPSGGSAPGCPEVEGGVGQHDAQQHDAAGEIGGECPLALPYGAPPQRSLFGRDHHAPTLGRRGAAGYRPEGGRGPTKG
ncbi:hypothetical protein [Streptomyces massasporeus]|uniref:hypothetical protein n=1 Tax=Streptomyces massasporeus TaxID=67324 RepID=UPI003817E0C7